MSNNRTQFLSADLTAAKESISMHTETCIQ